MFNSACPILPSSDFEATKAFYVSLGFTIAAEYVDQGYLILVRDSVEIHFFRHPQHDPATSDHGAYLRVKDAHALSAEYEKLGLKPDGFPRFVKAEDKLWGVCELVIVDTDGNLLRIGHLLDA
jgi:catechol 2,3-dioxygenase-like lactoylglutathione lyase family enzyme